MATMAIYQLSFPSLRPVNSHRHTSTRLLERKQRKRRTRGVATVVTAASSNFDHFYGVVKNDVEFLKERFSVTVKWANETLQLPKIVKKVDDTIWLRDLEDPAAPPYDPPAWPQPQYPALSGADLLVADLKALEAYVSYFYCLSKIWSRPLPDSYDPQEVATYFNCRPHIVTFRLLEVFFAFASAAIRIRISRIAKLPKSRTDDEDNSMVSQYAFGVVLKETMLNLGPTFVKIGQSLSTRPDLIGSEISKALSGLHDQLPPFPRALAMKIIEKELGSSVEKYFSYVSEEPVAAASFGQVYRGTTRDGCAVAIKVQRPNLRHVVVRDIYILRLGLGLLQTLARRKNDTRVYADELGKGLAGELDYRLEAENASSFMEAHSSFHFIRVPKVFPHLTRKRVLTMEWMVGENPTDLLLVSTGESVDRRVQYSDKQKQDARQRLLDLVNKGVEACLVQLLETGFLHADPHPGNLRYTTSGEIGFLDFGLMCRMERKHQLAMLASIVHIVNGDWESLVNALTDMDVIRPGTNTLRVTMELERSLGEVQFNDGIPDVKFSKVLGKIWSLALKYHFRMPPYYTLVLRSLASLEGLAIAADKDFKTFEAAYPYVVRKLLTDDSDASRKILHSVVLNENGDFQWKRLGLFLRVGASRKGVEKVSPEVDEGASSGSVVSANSGTFSVANFVLRLLSSKDGVVLRRLLMTANGASLTRDLLSDNAISVRQQLSQVIANILYRWMSPLAKHDMSFSSYSPTAPFTDRHGSSPQLLAPGYNYQSILRDRRLKVILFKILADTRKDPILFIRFCVSSFVMCVTAFTMASHRLILSLSEAYLPRILFAPERVAMST